MGIVDDWPMGEMLRCQRKKLDVLRDLRSQYLDGNDGCDGCCCSLCTALVVQCGGNC